jgi:hypothetical protein
MDTRDLTFPTPGDPPALPPLSQARAADVVQRAPSRTPDLHAAEPGADQGEIEYASWLSLLRPRIA